MRVTNGFSVADALLLVELLADVLRETRALDEVDTDSEPEPLVEAEEVKEALGEALPRELVVAVTDGLAVDDLVADPVTVTVALKDGVGEVEGDPVLLTVADGHATDPAAERVAHADVDAVRDVDAVTDGESDALALTLPTLLREALDVDVSDRAPELQPLEVALAVSVGLRVEECDGDEQAEADAVQLPVRDVVGHAEGEGEALCDLEEEGHALGLRDALELPVDDEVRVPERVADPDFECDDVAELVSEADGHALGLRETVELPVEDALRDPDGVAEPD